MKVYIPDQIQDNGPIPSFNERFLRLHHQGSVRSLASQGSVESIHDYVKEKEEEWRERHHNSSRKKIRTQTLIQNLVVITRTLDFKVRPHPAQCGHF